MGKYYKKPRKHSYKLYNGYISKTKKEEKI